MSDKPTTGEVLIRMASHALVAGATLPLGAPGPMIAAAGMVLFDAAAEADKRVWAQFNAMADDTLATTGMSLEDFQAWAAQDDAHLTFIRDLVATALTTLDEQKVRALGRVLQANLHDEAKVDDSILVLRALRDLEAPHIRVVRSMMYTDLDGTPLKGTQILGLLRWTPEDIGNRHPQIGVLLIFNVISTLERHGLITKVPSVSQTADSYVPTGFAMTCLNYLTHDPVTPGDGGDPGQ